MLTICDGDFIDACHKKIRTTAEPLTIAETITITVTLTLSPTLTPSLLGPTRGKYAVAELLDLDMDAMGMVDCDEFCAGADP